MITSGHNKQNVEKPNFVVVISSAYIDLDSMNFVYLRNVAPLHGKELWLVWLRKIRNLKEWLFNFKKRELGKFKPKINIKNCTTKTQKQYVIFPLLFFWNIFQTWKFVKKLLFAPYTGRGRHNWIKLSSYLILDQVIKILIQGPRSTFFSLQIW